MNDSGNIITLSPETVGDTTKVRSTRLTPEQRARATAANRLRRAKALAAGRCGVCAARECRPGLKTCDVCLGVGGKMARSFNVCCQAAGFHRVGCKG